MNSTNDKTVFDYCRYAVVPEIPYVEDVLYVLKLVATQKYYDFCTANHAPYVVNVARVVVAVGYDVLCMERYNEAEARRIIAKAIVALCPEEVRCPNTGNSAYEEALEQTGQENPESVSADTEQAPCKCRYCEEDLRKEMEAQWREEESWDRDAD